MLLHTNFFIIFFISIIIIFINCDKVSTNEINMTIESYKNNVVKNYEDALQFKINRTVSRFNILYNLNIYLMKLDKNKIGRTIEKLKKARNDPSNNIKESKLVEEINKKEKSFLRKYRQLLKNIKETNKLYLNCVKTIKKIFKIMIYIVLIMSIISIGIIIYVTRPLCKKYNILYEDKDKDKDKDKSEDENNNTNDSFNSNNNIINNKKEFKIVTILNRFMKTDKNK